MLAPITSEGYKLLHEGTIALSQVEHVGFKIDVDYLDSSIDKMKKKIRYLSDGLKTDDDCLEVYDAWKRRYGAKTNLGSREQLGTVLFDVLKIGGGERTESKRWKADKNALEDVTLPFVKKFLQVEKLKKAVGTYLEGIRREVDANGYLHPSFNLNIAQTFRSSSESPNTQNIPIRDPEIASIIRPCFIPRASNRQIGENDFGGIEVKVSACYNKDPNLLTYIRDPSTDMHRDQAMVCYMLSLQQVTKEARYCAKNKFVFPEFYGAWWLDCAQSLWFAIDQMGLKTAKGTPLKQHLKKKGITQLGDTTRDKKGNLIHELKRSDFLHHIRTVENDFWQRRFKVYNQWRWDWYNDYLEKGYFDTLTGFRCGGFMDRKQVCNYPIQGSAFHCLLWCLIRVQKILRKYKMKTVIIGQIHDSLLSDIAKGELRDFAEITQQVMTVDLLKHWKWIIVPMEVEMEVAPIGESWLKKEKLKI